MTNLIIFVQLETVRDLGKSTKRGSAHSQLEYLSCSGNNLTELNVQNNLQLQSLFCANNNLAELCISNNPQLTVLGCSNNNLTKLSIRSKPKSNSALIINGTTYYNYFFSSLYIGNQKDETTITLYLTPTQLTEWDTLHKENYNNNRVITNSTDPDPTTAQ